MKLVNNLWNIFETQYIPLYYRLITYKLYLKLYLINIPYRNVIKFFLIIYINRDWIVIIIYIILNIWGYEYILTSYYDEFKNERFEYEFLKSSFKYSKKNAKICYNNGKIYLFSAIILF